MISTAENSPYHGMQHGWSREATEGMLSTDIDRLGLACGDFQKSVAHKVKVKMGSRVVLGS